MIIRNSEKGDSVQELTPRLKNIEEIYKTFEIGKDYKHVKKKSQNEKLEVLFDKMKDLITIKEAECQQMRQRLKYHNKS